eukprot:TRINITY_DN1833_c0_g2_i1.p1 TRINITY_DN1833_c0_g2~~TRINITY_DN1833_c0_g2_i1.p1  ORF type:complete len:115 (-),score=12.88 TRINITY_DN1833_c0_g2_i1:385-729(-)
MKTGLRYRPFPVNALDLLIQRVPAFKRVVYTDFAHEYTKYSFSNETHLLETLQSIPIQKSCNRKTLSLFINGQFLQVVIEKALPPQSRCKVLFEKVPFHIALASKDRYPPLVTR